jgi:protein pelota
VKLGAYHTLELEPGRAFVLHKALWDALDIERIATACDPQASADLAALMITVRGCVCVCVCVCLRGVGGGVAWCVV